MVEQALQIPKSVPRILCFVLISRSCQSVLLLARQGESGQVPFSQPFSKKCQTFRPSRRIGGQERESEWEWSFGSPHPCVPAKSLDYCLNMNLECLLNQPRDRSPPHPVLPARPPNNGGSGGPTIFRDAGPPPLWSGPIKQRASPHPACAGSLGSPNTLGAGCWPNRMRGARPAKRNIFFRKPVPSFPASAPQIHLGRGCGE